MAQYLDGNRPVARVSPPAPAPVKRAVVPTLNTRIAPVAKPAAPKTITAPKITPVTTVVKKNTAPKVTATAVKLNAQQQSVFNGVKSAIEAQFGPGAADDTKIRSAILHGHSQGLLTGHDIPTGSLNVNDPALQRAITDWNAANTGQLSQLDASKVNLNTKFAADETKRKEDQRVADSNLQAIYAQLMSSLGGIADKTVATNKGLQDNIGQANSQEDAQLAQIMQAAQERTNTENQRLGLEQTYGQNDLSNDQGFLQGLANSRHGSADTVAGLNAGSIQDLMSGLSGASALRGTADRSASTRAYDQQGQDSQTVLSTALADIAAKRLGITSSKGSAIYSGRQNYQDAIDQSRAAAAQQEFDNMFKSSTLNETIRHNQSAEATARAAAAARAAGGSEKVPTSFTREQAAMLIASTPGISDLQKRDLLNGISNGNDPFFGTLFGTNNLSTNDAGALNFGATTQLDGKNPTGYYKFGSLGQAIAQRLDAMNKSVEGYRDPSQKYATALDMSPAQSSIIEQLLAGLADKSRKY